MNCLNRIEGEDIATLTFFESMTAKILFHWPHEWCEVSLTHFTIPSHLCKTLRHIQTLLCTSDGYIKFASILSHKSWRIATVKVGHTPINSIKDDDIIKLQTLGFVYRCDG